MTGEAITAKDFRTWKASALAASRLYDQSNVELAKDRKKIIKQVIAEVAETLGNTPAVCRKSYVHPGLFASYEAGDFPSLFQRFKPQPKNRVWRDELIFARFLRMWDPSKYAS